MSCNQTVSIWNWSNSTWLVLNSSSVGTTEVVLANLTATGKLSQYVSSTSGSGDVRVRVRCTVSAQNFVSSGDLLQILYDAPSVPAPTPTALWRTAEPEPDE